MPASVLIALSEPFARIGVQVTLEAEDDFTLSDDLGESAKARKILRAAINREWGSIALYLGMKELVPESLGKGQIDNIIKEEMRHVNLLSRSLTGLKG